MVPGTPMEGVVVSATLVDKGISTAPHGHKLEEGSDVTNNPTVTGKILRAPSNSCVGSMQPSISHALITAALLPPRSPPLPKLQPISEVRPAKVALFCDPSYPSLESMMIDPTYFFSFETQPIEVRLQSYRMMKQALETWLQISVPASVKSQKHSSRLRLPSTPIPKATQSNEKRIFFLYDDRPDVLFLF
ncbi:Hypothetical protein, putative [Bodo saltans]|uniref:Uncharacterized protein n=1 Tax=Bodo saltans TaxID=75058 RepID=A0A0S4KLZ6_BODSA|nr:Hypothetical protein, putative [Bodo saltans]|eukprot:CUI15405.1 Hypothetical protein, putative [Bodo saltans]